MNIGPQHLILFIVKQIVAELTFDMINFFNWIFYLDIYNLFSCLTFEENLVIYMPENAFYLCHMCNMHIWLTLVSIQLTVRYNFILNDHGTLLADLK